MYHVHKVLWYMAIFLLRKNLLLVALAGYIRAYFGSFDPILHKRGHHVHKVLWCPPLLVLRKNLSPVTSPSAAGGRYSEGAVSAAVGERRSRDLGKESTGYRKRDFY